MTILEHELEVINVLNSAMSGRYDAADANCRLRKLVQNCYKDGYENADRDGKIVRSVEFSEGTTDGRGRRRNTVKSGRSAAQNNSHSVGLR